MAPPIKIFCSYSHTDAVYQKELAEHLKTLELEGLIQQWNDRMISAGAEWHNVIDENLRNADIVLLLLSPGFIASGYCRDVELRLALERHRADAACVIPVIIRACRWQTLAIDDFALGALNALPSGVSPIASIERREQRDEVYLNVIDGISKAAEKIRARIAQTPPAPAVESRFLKPSLDPRRRRLLPYLCDRSPQKSGLIHALDAHRTKRPERPFACVVHGDRGECHDMFIERLTDDILPEALGLPGGQTVTNLYRMEWPVSYRRGVEPYDCFRGSLGGLFNLGVMAERRAVEEHISEGEPRPMVIYSVLNTRTWKSAGRHLIEMFCRLWNEWEDLPAKRTLICCIFIQYMTGQPDDEELNQASRKFLKPPDFFADQLKLDNEGVPMPVDRAPLPKFPRLGGVVLPELKPVHFAHASDWIVRYAKEICREKFDDNKWRNELLSIYQVTDPIPMNTLAEFISQRLP